MIICAKKLNLRCIKKHHYRFLVDGKPLLDPHAQGVARDHQGEKISLLAVS